MGAGTCDSGSRARRFSELQGPKVYEMLGRTVPFYSQQADIPQLAQRLGGQRLRCPLCGKTIISFAYWSGSCICGWNVDSARKDLSRQRWMPFSVAFIGASSVLGM